MKPEWCRRKADALVAAYGRKYGHPPDKTTMLLFLAVAIHESVAGDAAGWELSHNWGCCTLPGHAIPADTPNGWWLYPNGSVRADHDDSAIAQLHGDSLPGGHKYQAWFAAFPSDEPAAFYFLRWMPTHGETVEGVATDMYLLGYYTGITPGARPPPRALPLTPPEQRNTQAYVHALSLILPSLTAALSDYATGYPEYVAPPAHERPAMAPDQGQASTDEPDPEATS